MGLRLPHVLNARGARNRVKAFSLIDFFKTEQTDLSQPLSQIRLQKARSPSLEDHINSMTPAEIDEFGRQLSQANPRIVNRVIKLLPDIAWQPTVNAKKLAVTIVRESTPQKDHLPIILEAAEESLEVMREIIKPVGFFGWLRNKITARPSWSDLLESKDLAQLHYANQSHGYPFSAILKQSPTWYQPWVKDYRLVSQSSQNSSRGTTSLPGSTYTKASDSLPGSTYTQAPALPPGSTYTKAPGSTYTKAQLTNSKHSGGNSPYQTPVKRPLDSPGQRQLTAIAVKSRSRASSDPRLITTTPASSSLEVYADSRYYQPANTYSPLSPDYSPDKRQNQPSPKGSRYTQQISLPEELLEKGAAIHSGDNPDQTLSPPGSAYTNPELSPPGSRYTPEVTATPDRANKTAASTSRSERGLPKCLSYASPKRLTDHFSPKRQGLNHDVPSLIANTPGMALAAVR